MRVDNLTTAKMMQVVTNLRSKRTTEFEIKYRVSKGREAVQDFRTSQQIQEKGIKELVQGGISKDRLIILLEIFGYRNIPEGIDSGKLLEGYVVELEDLYPDNSTEDNLEFNGVRGIENTTE